MGADRTDVLKLVTLETLVICLVGGLGGILLGRVLTPIAGSLLQSTLVGYVPKGSIAAPSVGIALLSLSVAVATGILCALYPAWRAASIVPMEVLRNE